MVVLQLLSCGVPVIASNNTGLSDLIIDGYNGYNIPIRSSLSIADKINILFHDTKLLNEMKINASLSIENGYNWKDYGLRYKKFLNNII